MRDLIDSAGLLAAFADLSQPVLSPSDPSNPSSLHHPQHSIQLEHDPFAYENQLGLGPELQHLTQGIRGTSHQPSPELSAPIPKTNKKRKKTSTKDPNAIQAPKRPKPLPKKDKLVSAKVSEKGVDSEGGSAEQPVVMPTRNEVQTILDERYKTQRRLFFKMAGLTGGPGRPTTKPQPSVSALVQRAHNVFPNTNVLSYLTADLSLEKSKTLSSFLGGSKTTKLKCSSSTATWYIWTLEELRSVRDGLADLHLSEDGASWALLDEEIRTRLSAAEVEVARVLDQVEQGMLKVFGKPVNARPNEPEIEPSNVNLDSLPLQGLETMAFEAGLYEFAQLQDGNAVASGSRPEQQPSLEPAPTLADLRAIFPGYSLNSHLLPDLTLKTAKVMANFLSGAGVTKRTPDDKTRDWYDKHIATARHVALSLSEMKSRSEWSELTLAMKEKLDALQNELGERLGKLTESRLEVFGDVGTIDASNAKAEELQPDNKDGQPQIVVPTSAPSAPPPAPKARTPTPYHVPQPMSQPLHNQQSSNGPPLGHQSYSMHNHPPQQQQQQQQQQQHQMYDPKDSSHCAAMTAAALAQPSMSYRGPPLTNGSLYTQGSLVGPSSGQQQLYGSMDGHPMQHHLYQQGFRMPNRPQ